MRVKHLAHSPQGLLHLPSELRIRVALGGIKINTVTAHVISRTPRRSFIGTPLRAGDLEKKSTKNQKGDIDLFSEQNA